MSAVDKKRILDVGQCLPDHQSIREMIESAFEVEVEYAADIQNALERLSEQKYDLVLVNRIIDSNFDEGIGLIQRMKDSNYLRAVPVMMVSNFASAQKEATSAGATRGFGKADLDAPATRELLAKILS